ncbi:4-hydroxyphenylpyruvate dioxygenase [Talaromyces proteolyticus]|uniref:4-hydroxyphenylpyruvate dioxygenase n=1 Tax=Talaromyces proteolyticus TaxID=1131652 RepID=A0AAD4KYJ4_9EURO|nr:4-hydroxyphenylpyruvate dioxygenase [Talaromyces proteolyticus]KAH8701897.1 4-hydroxyphenylpyruvate dioxygenase [Talaromyces proteolyticus]
MPNRPAISSMSLGRAWAGHSMDEKIAQAAAHGFEGLEVFFEDIEYLARALSGADPSVPSIFRYQLEAARQIRGLCDQHGLEVVCLQPFMFYGGLKDRTEHQKCLDKLREWFQLLKVLGTDLIQVPTNFLPADEIASDTDALVKDMRQIADMGLAESPHVRFAFENVAWGTYIDTWEGVWEVVKRVDRPNLGLCLDTFNILGRIWADPASPTGKLADADDVLTNSLERLKQNVPREKVFYVQVVDAERLELPMNDRHPLWVEKQPPRMTWSRNCRLFVFENDRGGYMPVVDLAKVIFHDIGFQGWVSMELFSRSMASAERNVPVSHADRASVAWRKLKEKLSL